MWRFKPVRWGGRAALQRREKNAFKSPSLRRRPKRSAAERADSAFKVCCRNQYFEIQKMDHQHFASRQNVCIAHLDN